ncbi:3-hydroxybutyrate dehydrogenase [Nisaea sp.]|uniref:3-hydroxybutyrate dehydrogenase n=1 Tax=Nisaea sp. TaxID=2024842 RepID=UPI003266C3D7
MKGKTVIVTGSTSGIGAALAGGFAAEGANIVLNGLGDAGLIEAARAALAAAHGVEVIYHGANMARPDEIEALVRAAEGHFGGVDVLVNNAGVQYTEVIEVFPTERWDALIGINLSAPFHATRAVLPGMKRRGWGRIVNIASNAGLGGSVRKSAYVAAKHGVVGLTKVTGLENAQSGVTCNAICPGWVKTPLVDVQIEDRAKRDGTSIEQATYDLLIDQQPSGRFTTFEQLAETALFLCSSAADNMTGTTITLDGGWMAT